MYCLLWTVVRLRVVPGLSPPSELHVPTYFRLRIRLSTRIITPMPSFLFFDVSHLFYDILCIYSKSAVLDLYLCVSHRLHQL